MANAKAAIELLDDDNDDEVQDVTKSNTRKNDKSNGNDEILFGNRTMEPFQQRNVRFPPFNLQYSLATSAVAQLQPQLQAYQNSSLHSMVAERPLHGHILGAQSLKDLNRNHVVSIPVFDSSRYKPEAFGRSTSTEALYIPYSIEDAIWDFPNRLNSSSSQFGVEEYKLSLISVSEFTVRGVSRYDFKRPPSVSWMRIHIKKISKPHGKATFERANTSSKNDDNSPDSTNAHMNNHNRATTDKDLKNDDSFDNVDGGRWRIPLGAYQSFYSWLSSHSQQCIVEGIPPQQLKIASLGKDRRDRKYPDSDKLIKLGVPRGLAWALAPYQRGGVDFVVERGGKALIADEMGLGKSVQSLAAMAVYEKEWPLLILCPSSARYHWESEVHNWFGKDSIINDHKILQQKARQQEIEQKPKVQTKKSSINSGSGTASRDKVTSTLCSEDDLKERNDDSDGSDDSDMNVRSGGGDGKDWHLSSSRKRRKISSMYAQVKYMRLLKKNEIHVVSNGKDLWNKNSRVIIISYSIAISLIKSKRIGSETFQCIIVDESHMIKSLKTMRTKSLLPILKAATRCVLLSGTPAFAKPIELFPQLNVLSSTRAHDENVWDDFEDFVKKYCKGGGSSGFGGKNLSELHTLLVSTVMIRRKKSEVLSAMPQKIRERAYIKILDSNLRNKFMEMRQLLKNSTGSMGKLAAAHFEDTETFDMNGKNNKTSKDLSVTEVKTKVLKKYSDTFKMYGNDKVNIQLEEEIKKKYDLGMKKIKDDLESTLEQRMYDSDDTSEDFNNRLLHKREEMEKKLIEKLREYKKERLTELKGYDEKNPCPTDAKFSHEDKCGNIEEVKRKRQAVVIDMYYLSGLAKVPVILAKLKKWINDPAKGKLCIFAHHKDILELIEKGSGMVDYNNQSLMSKIDGNAQSIRIDGSTNPKVRHSNIQAFQSNPNVRVAFLGITAAGVAINLTAASTIWFAELFWTPAIMLQAEDRCHRIGQTAAVKCIYMIGRGTLDEVLWKLIANKFRSLGEFVEGKSKNIDLHKDGRILGIDDSDDDDEKSHGDEKIDSIKTIHDESLNGIEDIDICDEIKVLSGQEQAKMKNNSEDIENDAEAKLKNEPGSSKKMAICLSDDECAVVSPPTKNRIRASQLKFYKMLFVEKSYELVLNPHDGRVVVLDRSGTRLKRLGLHSRPHVGDVLMAIENFVLPYGTPFKDVVKKMRDALNESPSGVELTFIDYPDFRAFYMNCIRPKTIAKLKKHQMKNDEIAKKKREVIELIDDET